MSRPVAIIGLLLLGGLILGGYACWSYYRLLVRVHALSSALDKIHRHRGVSRVTAEELRAKAIAGIRARGASVSASDVTVQMIRMTPQTAATLPPLWRTRLNMACYHRRIQDVQDTRIENRIARLRGQPARVHRLPSTKPPSLKPNTGVSCAAHRLRDLDFTFVRVRAQVHVKVGWFGRRVTLDRRFYLDQRPQAPQNADDDDADAADADAADAADGGDDD